MVGNWSDAQDIAQETFIRVYANLDKLRDPARFPPWLRRVTFSVTMNWLRAYRPSLFKQLDGHLDLERLEVPDFQPGPIEVVEKRELARAVMRAVASLPSRYRVPLTMFHMDGLSYEKVAEFLDVPLGTAKSLIHRAREMIKPALGSFLAEEMSPMIKEVFDEHRLPQDFARNVIGGLERARWGGGVKENSVLGALEAALGAIGEKIPYDFLMGISGGAFRIQMHQPQWCPSSPHANCGFRLYPALAAALPYELVPLGAEQGGKTPARRAPRELIESIDQGVPAFYSKEEEALVVGYAKQGQEVLLRPYAARKDGYEPQPVDGLLSDWGYFEVLRRKESVPDRRESLIRSLQIAVELAHTPAYEESPAREGRYASGFAAYAYWIEGLRDESARDEMQMVANGHTFYSLIDARECAASYLEKIAGELGREAEPHLTRAAEHYREIRKILLRRPPVEVAPMPWMPAAKQWSRVQRSEQAALLEEAMGVERRAIAEIESALEALGRRLVSRRRDRGGPDLPGVAR
jgi:RNA polymerase sigma-70 factor (ECF subfamily)